jgi:D-alanyl-D-alanine carboxypeptidase/D-alanyl-D-alanine-endopeptidase (penicillin-binding protein 4)
VARTLILFGSWLAAATVAAATALAPLPPGSPGSFVAIDVATGNVLADHDADRWGTPASATKVMVAALALDLLGPEHRAGTRIAATAPPIDGVVAGDLILIPAADPTWRAPFTPGLEAPRGLAQQLASLGVRRVTGALVVDRSSFGGRANPPERAWSDLGWGRAAPSSALAFDGSAVDITIGPGTTIGAPAEARGPRWLTLRNEMRTVGAERHGRGTVDAIADPSCGGVLLRGDYPISEPSFVVRVALPDPDRRAAEVVLAELRAAGIEIGALELGPPGLPPVRSPTVVFAEVKSPPLVDWLAPILRDSDNWMADMLLRHLSLVQTGSGRLDDGALWLEQTLGPRFGVAAESFALADGSGLTPTGLTTSRALARLLAEAARRPWFPHLLGALPAPGVGTLRGWPDLAAVRAKTGTLARHVALAGYLETDGRLVAFAAMVGPVRDDRNAARRWISAQLRQLERRGSPALAAGK